MGRKKQKYRGKCLFNHLLIDLINLINDQSLNVKYVLFYLSMHKNLFIYRFEKKKKNGLMIAPDECCNECVLKLSEYAEEAILLQAAGKEFPKEVTLELGLTMKGFGRNSKKKELTKKYTIF